MPNANLENKVFNFRGESLKYTALAQRESRLKKAKQFCEEKKNCGEFSRLGGESALKEIETIIHKAQETDYNVKDAKRNGGLENQFIKTHQKNKSNARPTEVGGVPMITGKSVSSVVKSGQFRYNEGLEKEISEIRYLIEYITNNNKKQNL